jgi:hypothetical protein
LETTQRVIAQLLEALCFALHTAPFAGCAGELSDGTYLDTPDVGGRNLRRDFDGIVDVGGVDQIEPCQTLLGFSKRAIGNGHLSLAHSHGFGGLNGLQSFGGKASASGSERLVVSHALIVGHGANFFLLTVDKAYVFQWQSPLAGLSSSFDCFIGP